MRRYTIAKTFALFLGVLSVVARSLPERQSQVSVRSPGDVGDPKQRLEGLGLVMVSEDVLDGDIYTATYSISNNTVFPKRDTTLEKRLDIQGGHCQTYCVPDDGDKPDSDICKVLYTELKSTPGIFTVYPGQVKITAQGACAIVFENTRSDTAFTYSFWDFAGTAEWLLGDCIVGQNINYGGCMFQDTGVQQAPYIAVARQWP